MGWGTALSTNQTFGALREGKDPPGLSKWSPLPPCYALIMCLEPISKSPEEDNEASELYEAEEVPGVVFPTDEDAALPLNPGEEALDEPASHVAA